MYHCESLYIIDQLYGPVIGKLHGYIDISDMLKNFLLIYKK